ncbi:cyclin-D3-1-like [Cynara cardunculus var. scolymus]|uniref:Cyclin, C-terminal domain-containing protein n=1 Tax=Cynara cardunculus var. scolymus TaxID=59895 RepID=A0A103YCT7_CYNCS|nr:cyclin-D3-1-like [Cynara cardunculus var. scolymus]KVI06734.1 Cyclin, C-terminal domain-containing protein [Cynara cardunculus var. scolymus]
MMTLLDSLYCEEKHQWEEDEEEPVDSYSSCVDDEKNIHHQHTNSTELLQEDLFWEEQELTTLISKESQQNFQNNVSDPPSHHRLTAVEWILGVVSHYSFTALTAVLAVNYLDRFLDSFDGFESEKKKPWMTQLAAVSCLSLAAKVEETHVPLLLDLQMEGSKYVFEAKTIQKMEVLILSTLQWKMNPITPLSFLEYITRRLGLRTNLSSEFLKRCECLLLCFLPDGRFRRYLPSVIATATMVHVINSVEPCIGIDYQSQLVGILGINKEKVNECWEEMQEMLSCSKNGGRHFNKRKFGAVPGSPNAVMDLCFSSDESWSSEVSSSPETGHKKSRKDAAA